MPQSRAPDSVAGARSVEDQFLDLLLADAELLRAEFDAIIAAEWPDPPPRLPRRRIRGEPDPGGKQRHRVTATSVLGPRRRPHVDKVPPRQRSPPAEDHEKSGEQTGR